MVTAGTYQKAHHFQAADRLTLLHDTLLNCADEYGFRLQAWAVFSNHYHFIADSPEDPYQLRKLVSKLHATTAMAINQLDNHDGRKVWHQYWESLINRSASYLARIKYVQNNPVRHGLVNCATQYPWCSASWFERNSTSAFRRSVDSFKIDRLSISDDY